MNDEVAGKVLDAYKNNPLLTGILLLNFMMFAGFGWFILDKETKVAEYVMKLHGDMLDLAKTCVVPK